MVEFLPASPTGRIIEGVTKQIPPGTQGGPASMPTAHRLRVTVKCVWWPPQGISCVLTTFLLAPVITALVRFFLSFFSSPVAIRLTGVGEAHTNCRTIQISGPQGSPGSDDTAGQPTPLLRDTPKKVHPCLNQFLAALCTMKEF